MKELKLGHLTVAYFNNQTEKERIMRKMLAALLVAVTCAFSGMAYASSVGTHYTVVKGDTLTAIGKKNHYGVQALCRANPQISIRTKGCNDLRVGDRINFPGFGKKVQTTNVNGEIPYPEVGRAPLFQCGKKDIGTINNEAWKVLGLSQEDKAWLLLNVDQRGPRIDITPEEGLVQILSGVRLEQVTFCRDGKAVSTGPMRTTWSVDKAVYGQLFVLPSGRALVWMRNCFNWTTWTPPAKVVILIPAKPEPVVNPPVVESPPPVVEPEPELVPFHMTPAEAAKPRCELQAGLGVYGSRVYQGDWAYGETICYVWKDGEWQAGPGLYAMYGSGSSLESAYRGQELGYGFQIGAQRSWVNDHNRLTTLDLKLRLLRDKSWGENPESGYHFDQKGQKVGAYVGLTERINKEGDLRGVVGEYWKSFGQTVNSSWAGQPVQDRGSMSLSAFYETKLSEDGKWRQRLIGGVARTNWDQQNWLRGTYEVRYDEWLMCGPQVTLPIGGVSLANQPMSARDITSVGAFCRFEFGNKVREADAEKREAQLEFIPANSSASSDAGRPVAEATTPPE